MSTNKWRTFARSENWRAEKKAEREARVETPTIQADLIAAAQARLDAFEELFQRNRAGCSCAQCRLGRS